MQKIIISSVFLLIITSLQAQNLDRITISAGGNVTDKVSFSIGETFNLILAGGDFILETGSQGSKGNTGGNNNFVSEDNVISEKNHIYCYPNPTKNVIYFNAGNVTNETLTVQIIDISGKIVVSKKVSKSTIMDCKLTDLVAGYYILSVSGENGQVIGSAKFIKQ